MTAACRAAAFALAMLVGHGALARAEGQNRGARAEGQNRGDRGQSIAVGGHARQVPVPDRSRTTTPAGQPVATEERFRSTLTFDPRPIDGRRLPIPFPAFRNALPLGFMMPWLWDGLPPIGVGGALVQSPLPGQAGTGGVQLDVQPWRAQVYVDGVAAGSVEEFTGYYHHLEVNAGPHAIVIVAPDYEPLILDVFVSPGQVATYRGTLTRAPGR